MSVIYDENVLANISGGKASIKSVVIVALSEVKLASQGLMVYGEALKTIASSRNGGEAVYSVSLGNFSLGLDTTVNGR